MNSSINGLFTRLKRALGRCRRLYRERSVFDQILLTGNFPFVRFARPGHFYSPLPDMPTLHKHGPRIFARDADNVPGIDLDVDRLCALSEEFGHFQAALPFPHHATESKRFYLDNSYFSYGDPIIAYSMMRKFCPARIIEVGSGHSSAAMLDVNDEFFDSRIHFTFIEPHPERLFQLLTPAHRARYRIETKPVQDVFLETYATLEANDILFIDSSHVGKIDSDVLHLLFRVLPSLSSGVLVHFHDILWPFEYPEIWLREGRAWNEAYLLRAFLQYNPAFEIVYFNSFMEYRRRELLERHLPMTLIRPTSKSTIGNSSLWLRKN